MVAQFLTDAYARTHLAREEDFRRQRYSSRVFDNKAPENVRRFKSVVLVANGLQLSPSPCILLVCDDKNQVSAVSLAYNLTCSLGMHCGNGSLAYPATTLRNARVATAILDETTSTSAEEQEELLALQVSSSV